MSQMASLFLVFLFHITVVFSAIRLKINGSNILDPTNNNSEIHLIGFNWDLTYVEPNDSSMMLSLIPKTNTIRLLGILWDNSLNANQDCKTNNKSNGYIKESCITELDRAIKIITNSKLWVILVCRAEYAAGQDYPTYPDVFHNNTLKNEFIIMWKYIVNHYKTWNYIAAYEIMTEPRTRLVNQTIVKNFYQDVCYQIHLIDLETPCMIGPTPYYNSWMLNESLLINDTNTIYTTDYYVPTNYIQSNSTSNYTYPGYYACNIALPGWTCVATHNVTPCFCPNNWKEIVYVNKTWLSNILLEYPLNFVNQYNVPYLINQFGICETVKEVNGKLRYMKDILNIFYENNIHSTQWVWKWRNPNQWHHFELIHNFTNGTIGIEYDLINVINNTWNTQYINNVTGM